MSTGNNSYNLTDINIVPPYQYLVGLILILINGLIFGGNCLVIAAVATTKRLQNVTNLYVVSLATADLMVSVVVLPPGIFVQITKHWPLGAGFCKAWLTMDILLCTASILNLGCISVDRYLAITRPLIYATHRSKKLASGMICAVWILSCIITFPPILGWTEHQWREGQCMISIHKGFRIYSSMGSFFVPFLIMIFVYVNIFIVARRRRALLLPQVHHRTVIWRKERLPAADDRSFDPSRDERGDDSGSEGSFSTCRSTSMELPQSGGLKRLVYNTGQISTLANLPGGHPTLLKSRPPRDRAQQDRDEKKRERAAFRREHKTAKTLAIVVGSFSACWLPFFSIYLLEPFCRTCPGLTVLIPIATWLGYVNSVFNPFIYAFYNKEYAAAFRRLLRLNKCGEDPNNPINARALLSIGPKRA